MTMKKSLLLALGWIFLCVSDGLAGTYDTNHFTIQTDLSPRYVEFMRANLDAYYDNIIGNYFDKGWDKPLLIYYSQRQSDTQRLLMEHSSQGRIKYSGDKIRYGIYIDEVPAIYTHRLMDDGSATGWGTLFHEVTHHFVALNYKNPPTWFDEGLVCLLAEQSRIVKGKLLIGKPNPWREYALREMIEKGEHVDVRVLTSMSSKQFYETGTKNYHPVRALFYWLYETGHLKEYLQNVQQKGYALSVLEETVGKSSDVINSELLVFIKKNCYAGAYLQQAGMVSNTTEKTALLSKALELKPDYNAAWLEMARCHLTSGDIIGGREDLKHILDGPAAAEYPDALFMLGHSFYTEKDYTKALEYYKQALDYAAYNENMCEVYHWMGNCYHYLKDYNNASRMHAKFLECNWEPQRLQVLVDASKKYIEMSQQRLLK
jgi:tetratricopeptide (TPR) repeat protein